VRSSVTNWTTRGYATRGLPTRELVKWRTCQLADAATNSNCKYVQNKSSYPGRGTVVSDVVMIMSSVGDAFNVHIYSMQYLSNLLLNIVTDVELQHLVANCSKF